MSRRKGLEVFKFAVYVAAPIALTATVVYSPETLNRIIESRSYVVYPPEGPRPPSAQELHARLKAEREQ